MPKTGRVRRDDSLNPAKPRTQGPLVLVAALVTVVLWASAFIGIRGAPVRTSTRARWRCCAWL
ncbi:hypothetical protein SRABI98_02972 [Microbacterium sp. Bi98]|uniref:hypothetical protein n=1 Tax=Microbacterium sp. Bi98 TaxID=2821116 RepID=UPI001E0631C4|nr:hypothetical protein [Microbacterium sp. Bi98]CAH0240159.1 hypothetical protein SRABI98_02972 [Microbacterium sp. Bi98]